MLQCGNQNVWSYRGTIIWACRGTVLFITVVRLPEYLWFVHGFLQLRLSIVPLSRLCLAALGRRPLCDILQGGRRHWESRS
jgi:hypothetical protein